MSFLHILRLFHGASDHVFLVALVLILASAFLGLRSLNRFHHCLFFGQITAGSLATRLALLLQHRHSDCLLDEVLFSDVPLGSVLDLVGHSLIRLLRLDLVAFETSCALRARIKHEIVEHNVVFAGEDVDHILEVQILLIRLEHPEELVLGVVENLGEESVQVADNNGFVLVEDPILLLKVLIVVAGREHYAEVVNEGLDW